MRAIADFHIHSKYARACSTNMDLSMLEKYARIKGIDILGTGDFQHPQWLKELKSSLVSDGQVLRSKTGFPFIPQTEISLIYTQGGKGRRVHNLILAPDLEVATQIQAAFLKKGRIDYDGRPVFGLSCIELVEMMQSISDQIEIIPAHAWTPWFSVFGSNSGFNSLKECFEEKTRFIHAIETGLSSDPAMNWRLSSLDNIQLLSFSDAHSYWPHRMGREVTVFDVKELTYTRFLDAIRTGNGLSETIEVDPAYGKYHWDGHRACGVVLQPEESKKRNKMCPVCKTSLTIGVEHRVLELADRPAGAKRPDGKPFRSFLPLLEILGAVRQTAPMSKKTQALYYQLIEAFGNEFIILLDTPAPELEKIDLAAAQAIVQMRNGEYSVTPGYDGVYGELSMKGLQPREKPKIDPPKKKPQRTLGDF